MYRLSISNWMINRFFFSISKNQTILTHFLNIDIHRRESKLMLKLIYEKPLSVHDSFSVPTLFVVRLFNVRLPFKFGNKAFQRCNQMQFIWCCPAVDIIKIAFVKFLCFSTYLWLVVFFTSVQCISKTDERVK